MHKPCEGLCCPLGPLQQQLRTRACRGSLPQAAVTSTSHATGANSFWHAYDATAWAETAITGESAAQRATSVNTHGKPWPERPKPCGQGALCMSVDDITGRKSPGNEAESATPKGKDPPAPPLLAQGGPGAACHSYSNVAGGDAIH